MTVWWSRDATVCTCLLLVLCGLLAWVGGPLIGATGAVSSLSATALTRWTAPPLTQTIVRAWCAHRHVPLPPPPPRRLVSQASAVVVLSCSVDALTSMWNAEPVAALMNWSFYIGAVSLGMLAVCMVVAWPVVQAHTIEGDDWPSIPRPAGRFQPQTSVLTSSQEISA